MHTDSNFSQLLKLIKSDVYEYRDPPFKLSSGQYSHHYFDCRNILSSPNGFNLVGKVMAEILITKILNGKIYPTDMNNYFPRCELTPYETCYKLLDIKAIGGMATGSITIANAIMSALYQRNIDINSFFIRKTGKKHGKTGKVVGIVNKTDKIAIVEDVITTGTSVINAINTVQEERNGIVVAVLTLLDRQEGGSETITNQFKIPVISIFTANEIINP
jgi:orotate phosphoribosyltransferase